MSSGKSETFRFGRYTVDVTSLDKVFWPKDKLTKGDLVHYYRDVADVMVPHMEGRPLVMQRFPDGIEAEGFYHKDVPDYFPDWIETVEVKKSGGKVSHAVISNAASLVYVANQGCITAHTWLARKDALHNPDQLIFDLDPPKDGDFETVREGARSLRKTLEEIGLVPYLKTTGSKGLHVVCPLDRKADFDEVRKFARDLAESMTMREPEKYTIETLKSKRKGRLFLDYLRNAYAQTAVAPYSVRPLPGAPVATPLDWDELGDRKLGPQSYTIKNIQKRLGQKDDPWKGMFRHGRSLKKARENLAEQRAS